ncbi:MAG: type II secretion system F family protein [bacterium]|nr:type II secretion system F family protein [bacterium]
MPKFNFSVRDRSGKNISGTVTMDSRDQLIERLRDQGYFVNKITEIGENTFYERLDKALQRLNPIKLKDMSIFARLMSTRINAGLPILRSLRIIVKQTENTHLAEILQDVAKMVEEGYSLSHAMGQHPKVFDSLIVSLIRSGEESGSLDIVLDRIAKDNDRFKIRQQFPIFQPFKRRHTIETPGIRIPASTYRAVAIQPYFRYSPEIRRSDY